MDQGSGSDWRTDSVRFLHGFFADDVPEGPASRLGTWRCVVLLSALLAVLMREVFGSAVSLNDLSAYSVRIVEDLDPRPRRIVVEGVLRTGAGYLGSLNGVSEDEILEVLMIVLRWMRRTVGGSSETADVLTERAIDLTLNGTILGA